MTTRHVYGAVPESPVRGLEHLDGGPWGAC